jgi:hypothetical protein
MRVPSDGPMLSSCRKNIKELPIRDDKAEMNDNAGSLGIVITIIALAVAAVMIASMWKVFAKAGQPGWAAIVPIYNVIVLLKITGKPAWWIALFMIPFVNLIVAVMVIVSLAKSFGKGTGFGLGLLFFGFVFYPILGFGSASYVRQPATV